MYQLHLLTVIVRIPLRMTRNVQGRNNWRATRTAVGVRDLVSGVRVPVSGVRGPRSGVRGSGSVVRGPRALRLLWNSKKYINNKLRFAHAKDFPLKIICNSGIRP
jgi:hypothetical protein